MVLGDLREHSRIVAPEAPDVVRCVADIEHAVIFINVYRPVERNLLEVAVAGDRVCLLARLGERWQKHGGQDGDNRNHDEKLNKSKNLTFLFDSLNLLF